MNRSCSISDGFLEGQLEGVSFPMLNPKTLVCPCFEFISIRKLEFLIIHFLCISN